MQPMHLYLLLGRTPLCQGCPPSDCGAAFLPWRPQRFLGGAALCSTWTMLCNKLKVLQPLWVLVWIRAMPTLKAQILALRW